MSFLKSVIRSARVTASRAAVVNRVSAVPSARAVSSMRVRGMAAAAAPPPPPVAGETALGGGVYRGRVFPNLKGLFDAGWEAKNKVQWHQWGPFADIDICWLYNSNALFNPSQADSVYGNAGPSAALMRFKPNSKVPAHWHTGVEHILYLQGSQKDERGTWKSGDFVVNPSGTDHWDAVTGPEGCIVLTIWEKSAQPLIPVPAPKNN